FKRANTTTYEDGLMFNQLLEYGMNPKEIAIRLNVSLTRVEVALESAKVFKPETQRMIRSVGAGASRSKEFTEGKAIPAHLAAEVLALKHQQKLSHKETRKLLEIVMKKRLSGKHIRHAAKLTKGQDLSLEEIIEKAEDSVLVRVEFA